MTRPGNQVPLASLAAASFASTIDSVIREAAWPVTGGDRAGFNRH